MASPYTQARGNRSSAAAGGIKSSTMSAAGTDRAIPIHISGIVLVAAGALVLFHRAKFRMVVGVG